MNNLNFAPLLKKHYTFGVIGSVTQLNTIVVILFQQRDIFLGNYFFLKNIWIENQHGNVKNSIKAV